MLLPARLYKYTPLVLSVGLIVFLFIKWARVTVPERAQALPLLHSFAQDAGRSFFPPLEHGCSSETLPPAAALCRDFPSTAHPHVQIVVKTGAGERVKMEKAATTFLSCTPDLLIFSDAEDSIDGHPVIDILADLPPTYALDNPDWPAYEAQKAALSHGETVSPSAQGWTLDRYKFLPMIERAFAANPAAEWYFFVEGDIYFFHDTLSRLLSPLDPRERHFLGAAVPGSNHTFFGYGGGGTILSHALLHDLLSNRTEAPSVKYESWVRRDCCGDALLAYVLYEELGVRIRNAYPTLSGEAVNALGVSAENWCFPLLSLHRVEPEMMERLWRWERCRAYDENPLFLSTILDFALAPLLRNGSSFSGWDNFSDHILGPTGQLLFSASSCEQHCFMDERCLQWTYFKGQCRTAEYVKGGQPAADDVSSGWDLRKLERLGFKIDGGSSDVCHGR